MKPVLPGFAGHVPSAIKTLYPDSKIYRLGDWGSFNSTYCCTFFLDPSDSLFQVSENMTITLVIFLVLRVYSQLSFFLFFK